MVLFIVYTSKSDYNHYYFTSEPLRFAAYVETAGMNSRACKAIVDYRVIEQAEL